MGTARRYSLRVQGTLLDPEMFNEIGTHNPRGLKKDAAKVAGHLARGLGVEVELVKHLATGDRDEGYYRPGWNC
jgi:hypothetical protein